MGASLFLLVPVAAGFSIAIAARGLDIVAASGLLALLCVLVVLVAIGREGPLCALLAIPVILAGLAVGAMLGLLVRKLILERVRNRPTATGCLLLLGPMLVVGGDKVESRAPQHARIETVQNSIEVPLSPDRLWNSILAIDNIQSTKPLLMHVGLPVPQRCVLQGKGVGAKRTCYFDSGYIQETITTWNPPYQLGLSIDRTHMPGRHWLGFVDAGYRLESRGNSTRLTRTTTISSHLRPAWYWAPFERMGVDSEHRYILDDVLLKASR
jgi:hypothetical protein